MSLPGNPGKAQMAGALENFLLANLVACLAEERGKGEFASRSKASAGTVAYRLTEGDKIEEVNARKLRPGDRVVVKAGQIIPDDGEVVQGIASIDESAVTGESAPVICEAQGVRRSVCARTLVISGQIVVQITSGARTSFLDRMILLMRGAWRRSKARSKTRGE
jgi:K+-transporting ATPase ATPase B chain